MRRFENLIINFVYSANFIYFLLLEDIVGGGTGGCLNLNFNLSELKNNRILKLNKK